jgi:hypothetical protein
LVPSFLVHHFLERDDIEIDLLACGNDDHICGSSPENPADEVPERLVLVHNCPEVIVRELVAEWATQPFIHTSAVVTPVMPLADEVPAALAFSCGAVCFFQEILLYGLFVRDLFRPLVLELDDVFFELDKGVFRKVVQELDDPTSDRVGFRRRKLERPQIVIDAIEEPLAFQELYGLVQRR